MKLYTAKGRKKVYQKKRNSFAHLARKVAAINALTPKLSQELAENQEDLFRKMELPLSIILAEMEISGIKVDATRLQEMKGEFSARLRRSNKNLRRSRRRIQFEFTKAIRSDLI